MTIHTLNLKDGSAVEVEAPRGTPIEELIRLANQQMGFTPLAPGARPESTRERDELIAQRLAEARKRYQNLKKRTMALLWVVASLVV